MTIYPLISAVLSLLTLQARADQVPSSTPRPSTAREVQVQGDADALMPGAVTPPQSRRLCDRIARAEQAPVPGDRTLRPGYLRTHLVCAHVLTPLGGLACYDWTTREWYGLGGIFIGTGGGSFGLGWMIVDHPVDAPIAGDYACVHAAAGLGVGGTFLACRAYGSGQYLGYLGAGIVAPLVLQGSPVLTLRKF